MTHNTEVREFAADTLSESELDKVSGGDYYNDCTANMGANRAIDTWYQLLGQLHVPAW